MSWTVTGIIWTIIIIVCMLKPIRYIKALTMVSFLFQGARAFSIHITETDISLPVLTTFFLLIKVIISFRITINRTGIILLAFLLFIFVQGCIATNLFRGYTSYILRSHNQIAYVAGHNVVQFGTGFLVSIMYIAIYSVAVILSSNIDEEPYCVEEFTERVLKIMVIIVFVFGIIQLLEFNHIMGTHITQTLIQNKLYAQEHNAFHRGYDRLYSIFNEPSYCGSWINGCLWYFVRKRSSSFREFYICLCAIVLVLSLSGTGIVAFCVCITVFLVSEKDRRARTAILYLITFGGLFLITPVGRSVINAMMTKLTSDSWVVRMSQDVIAWRAFLDSYMFGMGCENVLGFRFHYTLLAQVGLLGFLLFCWFLFKEYKAEKHDRTPINYFFLAIVCSLFVSFSGIAHHGPLWSILCLNESMLGGYKGTPSEKVKKIEN